MERIDSRLLPVAVLNERRRRAVMLRLSGMRLEQVCTLCEVCRNTVITAVNAYHAGGWGAVAVREHRGPDKGQGCLRNEAQQEAIRILIRDHTPDALGWPFALWRRAAVTALIARDYGITLAVQAWLDCQYPAIERRAKAEGGEIYWGDETGLRSDDVRGRSYAVCGGDTPVVRPCHRRENVAVMSAVTNRGAVRWMILKRAMNPVLLLEFLRRLIRDAQCKVFLVLDNLPAHHAPAVVAWLDRHRDCVEVLFYLPSYSPELNPDELLNADLNAAITKKAPARHKGELKKTVISHLRRIATSPDRVKKYFEHAPVKYAA